MFLLFLLKKGPILTNGTLLKIYPDFCCPGNHSFSIVVFFFGLTTYLHLKKIFLCQSTNKSTKVTKKMQKTKRKSVMCKPGPHLVTEIYTHGRCLFLSTFHMKGRLIFNHKPNLSNFSTFMPCQNAWIKPLCCVTDEASMLISNEIFHSSTRGLVIKTHSETHAPAFWRLSLSYTLRLKTHLDVFRSDSCGSGTKVRD